MGDLPARIGRFDIQMELGRGAMGCVYLAHDPKINRKVAIKTIRSNPASSQAEADDSRSRFLREAQAAGQLLHPGIITIFDVGEEHGESYIAMEYIDGPTLEAATKPDNLLPVEKAVDLVRQAAYALHFAHQRKIIHRDVKPANLMLVDNQQIKVTDFGLAKNPSTDLTSAGTLIGTPTYMSPEQIMGKALDGRSDLFSLGVVLYELLTGDRPFGGESISTIIYKILHEIPRRPDLANPRVPAPLSKAILRAIEKDPAKRYASCEELGRVLEEYLRTVTSAGTRAVAGPAPTQLLNPEASAHGPEIELFELPTIVGPPGGARATGRRPGAPSSVAPGAAPAPGPERRSRAPVVVAGTFLLALAGAVAAVWTQPGLLGRVGLGGLADRLGLQVAGPAAAGSADAGGAVPAPEPGPAVDLPMPLPEGEVVSVDVTSDPPGARIYLDNQEVAGGTITIPKDDTARHTVVAESDCFVDRAVLTAAQAEPLVIQLRTPRLETVQVSSEPPGAAIYVDGRSAGTRTPAEINVALCAPHTIEARLDGHESVRREFAEDADWVSQRSIELQLPKLPDGTVMVKGPYGLKVLSEGRVLGSSGQPITLPAGSHRLTVVNEDLFVRVEAVVEVPPGGTVQPRLSLPGVGRISVHANPSNGEVTVNGRRMGSPPILDLEIAEGTYKVDYELPSGRKETQTVLVISGQLAPVKFRLN